MIPVEVAFALPEEQVILDVEVPDGSTVEQAIKESGILEHYPQIELGKNKVGIFGKLAKLDSPVHPRDRVEIYRPLIADPKEVRKKRAAEGKKMKRGGGDID
jgi:putative ubiquitin-RnfH superfamily antitoxin RatB of RatAB toxin-antitoxin module